MKKKNEEVRYVLACKAGGFSDGNASKTAITNDQPPFWTREQNGGWSLVIAVLEAFPSLKPPALKASYVP